MHFESSVLSDDFRFLFLIIRTHFLPCEFPRHTTGFLCILLLGNKVCNGSWMLWTQRHNINVKYCLHYYCNSLGYHFCYYHVYSFWKTSLLTYIWICVCVCGEAFSSIVATISTKQITPKLNSVKQLFCFANKFYRSILWTGLYEYSFHDEHVSVPWYLISAEKTQRAGKTQLTRLSPAHSCGWFRSQKNLKIRTL